MAEFLGRIIVSFSPITPKKERYHSLEINTLHQKILALLKTLFY